jgi:hypothetical protein
MIPTMIIEPAVEGFKEDDAIELLVRESFTEQSALAFNIETHCARLGADEI